MDVLESQVEALIFNYLSFGFLTTVHTFWTLIAVLTAAVSFWRIRAIGSILSPHKSDDCPSSSSFHHHHDLKFNGFDSSASLEEPEADEDEKKQLEKALEICSCSYSTSTFVSAVAIDGNVKTKLTVYYDDEDNSNGYVNDEEEKEDVNLTTDLTEEEKIVHVYGGDWEMEGMLMMRRRMEDFGWYRCQDLSSLNGSVIKLWEEGRRRSTTTTTTLDGGVGKVW